MQLARVADNDVSVINTEPDTPGYNTVVATVPVGRTPTQIAVNSDGTRVYVTNTTSSTVSVIDAETYEPIVDSIAVGSGPQGVAVSPDGSLIYVTHAFDGTMSVIAHDAASDTYTRIDFDPATPETIDPLSVGAYPLVVAVDPIDGNFIYVAADNQKDPANTVTVISIQDAATP